MNETILEMSIIRLRLGVGVRLTWMAKARCCPVQGDDGAAAVTNPKIPSGSLDARGRERERERESGGPTGDFVKSQAQNATLANFGLRLEFRKNIWNFVLSLPSLHCLDGNGGTVRHYLCLLMAQRPRHRGASDLPRRDSVLLQS